MLVADFIELANRRAGLARQAGGISAQAIAEGRPVPDGWHYDDISQFWLPPNFAFFQPPVRIDCGDRRDVPRTARGREGDGAA